MILDKTRDMPLYKQLFNYFKHAIESGQIKANEKLPSIRELSKQYEISKTTIEKCYHQLLVEGYIESIAKSGYYVKSLSQINPSIKKRKNIKPLQESFLNKNQHQDSLDFDPFRKTFNHAMSDHHLAFFEEPSTQGELELRLLITKYLEKERAVETTASHIIIASGIQMHIMSLSFLLTKKSIAYLDPLFDRARMVFELLGYTLIPCKTIDELIKSQAHLIYISPSNIYPTGDIIEVRDRLKLIDYAKAFDAYIIEDDYNHLFRYDAYQTPSIQGLSNGENVIYIGSFSRNILLSLRTSYMVLPEPLLQRYLASQKLAQSVSKIDQLALATYIEEGHFEKQLRRSARMAKRQNQSLLKALDSITVPEDITITGLNSNLHMLLTFKDKALYQTYLSKVKTLPISFKVLTLSSNALLIPYSGLDETGIIQLVKDLFKN